MILLCNLNKTGEYFIMARRSLTFRQFGIDLPDDEVIDKLVEQFNDTYRGQVTIDELLLHPRDALLFCDAVRARNGWIGLPDDMVLRPILALRKSPGK